MSPLRLVLFAILAYLVVRTVRRYMPEAPKKIPAPKRKKKAPLPPAPPEETIDGKTPYEILGIERDATAKEIRVAYQRLVKEYHPDRAATLAPEIREIAEKRTRQLNRAYAILTKDQS